MASAGALLALAVCLVFAATAVTYPSFSRLPIGKCVAFEFHPRSACLLASGLRPPHPLSRQWPHHRSLQPAGPLGQPPALVPAAARAATLATPPRRNDA